jgi:hypothetical protein
MEEQEKYQQMLDSLNDEDRLKLRNALEDLEGSLLETSMEDLEGFVKEKYPNAKILQGNVVQDGQVIGKTLDLYKEDAYNNFIEELYDEQFQKSLGIQPDSAILPEGELKDKRLADFAEDLQYGFPEEMKAAEQLADEDFFNKNIQPQIDDFYADMAAREPSDFRIQSYYESLNENQQAMVDDYLENEILDSQNISLADDINVKGKTLKKVLSSRLKSLFIGGINFLDAYELGLIGVALLEPAVEKVLKPIMPMIIPGYKPPQNNESYKDQVIANLQETAKISPTAKLVEKMPEKVEYEKLDNLGYGWLGKMLDR